MGRAPHFEMCFSLIGNLTGQVDKKQICILQEMKRHLGHVEDYYLIVALK
jgi:hypothetical protein